MYLMMKRPDQQPYVSLGTALKKLREKHAKSHAELSGAVEVDVNAIQDYELGRARPSEDILLLIIQHYDLKDEEAKKLWSLAGYGESRDETQYFDNDDDKIKQTKTVMVNAQDIRIVYTDMLQVMVNNYGVVINFLQGAGINDIPLAVSRVGMSKEHAQSLIDILTKTLKQAEEVEKKPTIKQLPANIEQKKQE